MKEQTEIAAWPGMKSGLSVVNFQGDLEASYLKNIWRKLRITSQKSWDRKYIVQKASVHCWILTEMIGLMVLDLVSLYKLTEL